ncbi:MAG TPA: ABC transporter permease [Candidatus Acidoferrum sp.]|nr:ABC transporter permease [Candidatus Acidoferrum sp.]
MSLLSRLRGLLRIKKLERELDEELRAHMEMRAEDNRAAGMTPEEARYDARRRFGNATLMKEDAREMDIVKWMETAGQNLRYAVRMLRRSPGFTAVAILTLALGIGANVATFTVVHAVLLNPLPFAHPEQLVRAYDDLRGSNTQDVGMSVPEFWDLRDKSGVFQGISAAWPVDANLTGGEHPDRVEFLGTSTNYFTLLGVRAQLGRVYTVEDSQPGFTDGITISDGFWRRMFGGDPNVLGKKIRLDRDLYTIIGVLPPGFRHPGRSLGGSEVEVFAAAGFSAAPFPVPPQRAFRMMPGAIARLKPGLTVAQAQARLDAFTAQLSREFPAEYSPAANWGVRLVQVQDDLVGKVRTELLVLFGAVGCVLLIACVNLANLLLARSASRQREIAIRQALGAGHGRLIGQLLTESILLATISGVVALMTVVVLKNWLLRLAPADLPRLNEVSLSPGVLLFAFAVSIVTGVIFGLAPALQTVRPKQVTNLREGSRGSGSSKHQMKISRTLVASEIALSLVLLIGAGLLLRSFWHLIDVQPGFDPHHVVTAKIWLAVPNDPAEDNYRTNEKRAAFHQEVLRRIRGLAGVEDAAVGGPNSLPMGSAHFQLRFTIESLAADSERAPVAEIAGVSPNYFSMLKTPLLRGRPFSEADDSKGQRVALVNETLARKYWPIGEAVGQHILFTGLRPQSPNTQWITIVGVVGDIKSDGLDAATAPRIYLPVNQSPNYGMVVYLRTNADPGTLGDTVRREVQSIDPSIPVFGVRTMDEVVAKYLEQRRFALELLGVFAGVALLLASIGIYGVMAYTFSQRTNEIGIRMAMGAQRGDILKIAVGEGALIVAFGLAAGLAGSLALTRFLQTMLFDVKPTDPITFLGISALLTAVALAACFVPARRATRVDPLIALRHE